MAAACEEIAAETKRVLLRHKGTGEMSVAELYEMTAQRNDVQVMFGWSATGL